LANRRTIVGCLRAIGRIAGHEIGIGKNTTVIFPPPLMSTTQELGGFLPGRPRRSPPQPQRRPRRPPSR
jgi:hypothetical protein